MITLRKSKERGYFNHGWLETYHTFSFSDYYDPKFMGFRSLRVINEDTIAAAEGFPTHGHRDMEIITYITEGALEHRDTLGSHAVMRPGEVQYMSAGKGIKHSEFNHLKDQSTHLLQIWIMPDQTGHEPRYGQKNFLPAFKNSNLVLTISPDGRDGSIAIHQDAYLWVAKPKEKETLEIPLRKERHAWVQIVKGTIELNGLTLNPGDGAAVSNESLLKIAAKHDSELLIFDLN